MKANTLSALLLASALGLSGCAERKLEARTIREFIGNKGEKITESLFWQTGDKYKNRQVDIVYSNGVHIRAVDVHNDGKIDGIYVSDNPNKIHIVKDAAADQEIMRLPNEAEVQQYLSKPQ